MDTHSKFREFGLECQQSHTHKMIHILFYKNFYSSPLI